MMTDTAILSNPQFRALLDELAQKATTRYPACAKRIASATRLILSSRAMLNPDGTATIQSEKTEGKTYTVNGHCSCVDAQYGAPDGMCKHRFAKSLLKRALQDMSTTEACEPASPLVARGHEDAPLAQAPLPEAPVSITLKGVIHGQEVLVTLRGTDFASVRAQVEQACQWLKAQSPQPAVEAQQCPIHGVPMKRHEKGGTVWYSHRNGAKWCKGQ